MIAFASSTGVLASDDGGDDDDGDDGDDDDGDGGNDDDGGNDRGNWAELVQNTSAESTRMVNETGRTKDEERGRESVGWIWRRRGEKFSPITSFDADGCDRLFLWVDIWK